MDHGAIYNAGRLGCVAGWFAAIQALVPLSPLQWAPLERRCVVAPLMLACLVTLLHTPCMSSHHPDTRAKLGFVERVTYYASIQAAALLLLVHFSVTEPEPEPLDGERDPLPDELEPDDELVPLCGSLLDAEELPLLDGALLPLDGVGAAGSD